MKEILVGAAILLAMLLMAAHVASAAQNEQQEPVGLDQITVMGKAVAEPPQVRTGRQKAASCRQRSLPKRISRQLTLKRSGTSSNRSPVSMSPSRAGSIWTSAT